VQPCDVAVILKNILNTFMDRQLDELKFGSQASLSGAGSAVGERRVLLIKAVGEAWQRFQEEDKMEMVARSFRR
jgi:DNA repair protein RadC